jgi:hypothetical protein
LNSKINSNGNSNRNGFDAKAPRGKTAQPQKSKCFWNGNSNSNSNSNSFDAKAQRRKTAQPQNGVRRSVCCTMVCVPRGFAMALGTATATAVSQKLIDLSRWTCASRADHPALLRLCCFAPLRLCVNAVALAVL